MSEPRLTSAMLLRGYATGIFPMAEHRDDPDLFWVDPRHRGIMPLGGFHMSRSLARRMRSGQFTATADTSFAEVLNACAARDETWINPTLFDLYLDLAETSQAHSVEVWQDGALAGGVFGVRLGGAFFGESMFSAATDGSKAALAWLVDALMRGRFQLFDVQFLTAHLATLGAVEIPRAAYKSRLNEALPVPADFPTPGALDDAQAVVQRMTQTS
ncbi:MAG: leucyl/phenylalanyl-tRNA--protein transferase [Pseudomonadota bacterium]